MRFARSALPLVLPLVAFTAAPAVAQEEVEREEHCICFTGDSPTWLGGTRPMHGITNRARIGVMLGDAAEADGATGVRVEDVVEDGPADDAGIRPGDILTAIDGEPLGDEPAGALVDALAAVEPGETVTLTYDRDGRRGTATVVTDTAPGFAFLGDDGFTFRMMPGWGPDRDRGLRLDPARRALDRVRGLGIVSPGGILRRLSPGGLELVDMNPGLGEYFGTDEGVLVTEVDDDSTLGLRPGDVILAIDGRDVMDPAHVRAILDSYRAEEDITIRVVRDGRTIEVSGTH